MDNWTLEDLNLRSLAARFRGEGRIQAIVLRPAARAPAQLASQAQAVPGRGLLGDRRAQRTRSDEAGRRRELTLFQFEHLPVLGQWCGMPSVDVTRLRRNLVVSGLNLVSMRFPFPNARLVWRIGDEACIELTGSCDPCSHMERELGSGGYNAMRGHGGMTALIVQGVWIRVGDRVVLDRIEKV